MTPAPMSPHVSVDLVTVATSPLMRAAASLLVMLGRLRGSLVRAGPNQLMDQVAQAIEQFEIDARAAGVPSDQIETAKYTLAATADDIVQNLPTADSRTWTQYSMLVRFFNERMGGVRFFKELERAKQNPAVNLGVLEIMHACLSLGFEGVYRASGGPGAAQGIRRDLYETIRRAQPKTIEDLSPHWRGQAVPLSMQPSSDSGLGGGGGCRGHSARFLPLSAQRPFCASGDARIEDGGDSSGGGIDDRSRNHRQAAAGSEAEDIHATRAHPRGAGQGDHCGQGGRRPIRDDDLHSDRQCGAVSFRRREGQRCLRAHRGQDRRRARPGAGRHSCRGLHRRRSDSHRRFPVELRALARRAPSRSRPC